jgi:hypothetical protein
MSKFIMDMAGTPAHAFAALHKIWCCTAEEATASLQSSHAEELASAREARKRSSK